MKTRRCHVCKCTDTNACPGRCWWIGEDLCSSCGIRAARHLQERAHSGRPKKFWWTRHVDIEMGFVVWCLRYLVNGRMYGSDLSKTIEEIQQGGRDSLAAELRMIRFHHRIRLAGVRGVARERRSAT